MVGYGQGLDAQAALPQRPARGDVVAVLGPGVRGLSACAAAKEAGAGFVMITGVGPHDDERLALAAAAGRAGRERDWDVLARRYEHEVLDTFLPH